MKTISLTTQTRRKPKVGFTLLEVLLTSLLAAIVLVSLWSLSEIYLRLFVSGKKKIEEVQLVRGLTQQLAKDVSQAIQLAPEPPRHDVPPAEVRPLQSPSQAPLTSVSPPRTRSLPENSHGQTAGGTVSQGIDNRTMEQTQAFSSNGAAEQNSILMTPRFGLFGSKRALRLIVLQPDPLAFRKPTDLSEMLPEPGQPRKALASDLRTIHYSFVPPHESSNDEQRHPPGLIRREWPWELWSGLRLANPQSAGTTREASMMPPESPEWTEEDAIAFDKNQNCLHLPQVTALEFRYFDGEDWQSEWNSWERHQLPRLVECLFKVNPSDQDKPDAQSENEEDFDESQPLADQASPASGPRKGSRSGIIYRRLIQLPASDATPAAGPPGRSGFPWESTSPATLMGSRRP